MDIGSNAYALRVQGEFTDAHQMDDLVIGHKNNKTIYHAAFFTVIVSLLGTLFDAVFNAGNITQIDSLLFL